ncbi:DNA-binding protein [Paenibacillus cucumis (ex Kampfer et al. 2016)]|uniref:DNA-binding protein n=1 Tax=Paenibacillus cucumis (ex Kampfer et al. 2016) TaxID=1776858 RepID=A0ABS7KF22_9BACL|nr:DNA-binding protein [Paenibacillus cucumis (ex Kampfer et al. 2016)]MBY0202729.1 DNA-binding protein [Paenibacillus cucumis (ex Kampfer et al. 2016)]
MRPSILKSLKPDIIVEMLDMAVAFENWNKVLETADVLYQCAQCIYEERVECQEKGGSKLHTHTERPLVYYIGWSHMMRGMAYQKLGQIDQARACIRQYATLGCMEGLDEAELQVVQEFKRKAEIYRYALEIEAGQVELLEGYVNLLLEYPEERLSGLKVITEAAVRHGWRIDFIIHMLEEKVDGSGVGLGSLNNDDMYHYCYQRALYEQWIGRPQEAVDFILKAMRVADRPGMERQIIRCTAVLESLRKMATEEQIEQYRVFLAGIK